VVSGKTVLILPDSHAKPGVSNARYDWLARMIVDRKPDIVIDLGDFADMESLSSYDKGKLSGQNRHVGRDIEVAVNARKRLTEPIHAETERLRQNKRKIWAPRLVAIGGNHEWRIDRYINDHPELKGIMKQDISKAAEMGWEWYDYQARCVVEGFNVRHRYEQGGRPVTSAKYPAAVLLDKGFESALAGDSHKWDIATRTTWSGKKIAAVICGCYFGHEEAYAGTSNADWDRCITILYGVENGGYSGAHDKIPYDQVRHDYGGIQ